MNDDFRVKRITKYKQIMCDVEQMIENGIYNLLERYHELKGRKQMETERRLGGNAVMPHSILTVRLRARW